ncbi:MAG: flippase [Lachnospiraceae bacterium]|jgi:O-antigen/teichoic acid export membrane protein
MGNKSLAKNSIYNVIYKGLNVVFPLATSMYVSRVLLSGGIGQVASAKNLVTYFTLLAALGLPTYGTKKIAENKDCKEKLERVFSELFLINLISTFICAIAYYSIVISVGKYRQDLFLYIIVGLQVVLNIFNIDWVYQGIEEYKYIMVRSFAIKIISFVFIVIFVRNQDDYLFYAFASVLGVALNYVLNVFHLRKILKFRLRGLNLQQHMKVLIVLFSSSIAVEIYTLSDITMLTMMTDKIHVGYYSNAINGIKTIKDMIVAVCAVFLPRLSYYYSQKIEDQFKALAEKGVKILLFFSLPAATGCFLLADKIVVILFGADFANAILTVRILTVSIVTIGISNFIGYQILVVVGKEKIMLIISSFGTIFNIFLNYFLIRNYAHNGAAIASATTEIIVCIMYLIAYNDIIGLRWFFKYFIKVAAASLCMAAFVSITLMIHFPTLISLVSSVIMGVVTYIFMSVILKNEMSILVLNKIHKSNER